MGLPTRCIFVLLAASSALFAGETPAGPRLVRSEVTARQLAGIMGVSVEKWHFSGGPIVFWAEIETKVGGESRLRKFPREAEPTIGTSGDILLWTKQRDCRLTILVETNGGGLTKRNRELNYYRPSHGAALASQFTSPASVVRLPRFLR